MFDELDVACDVLGDPISDENGFQLYYSQMDEDEYHYYIGENERKRLNMTEDEYIDYLQQT